MLMRPWFVHHSIFWLEDQIQPEWVCFEWGSGWSTIWLAEQTTSVVSVEHDPEWYDRVGGWLKEYNFAGKVELNLLPLNAGYAEFICGFPKEYFDLIEIDGRRRADCLIFALARLKPGGLLIIDNSEREQYQDSINAAGIKRWEGIDFHSGNSEGWTTSVYFKPKG